MFIDRRFISNLRFTVKDICSTVTLGYVSVGFLYIVGENPSGAFADYPVNSIILINYDYAKATKVTQLFYIPTGGECVFIEAANAFYCFDATNGWVSVVNASPNNDGCAFIEVHTLTADEVSAKSFTLSNSIASGEESNTICIVNGVAQVYNTDFYISGKNIKWTNLGLAAIGLLAGDTFVVLYRKANS